MKILGIIPARGGSKGILRKNLQKIGELSLIGHTVESAKGSSVLTTVIGTTDDEEIAEEFKRHGCECIIRPKELAEDKSPIIPTIQHAVDIMQADGEQYGLIMLLQPTCPFRSSEDIDESVKVFEQSNDDLSSVVSVYQVDDAHPSRMYRFNGKFMTPVLEEPVSRRRQELEPIYHRNGAIYLCPRSNIEKGDIIGSKPVPYIMPFERSINIDSPWDLIFAQTVYQQLTKDEKA